MYQVVCIPNNTTANFSLSFKTKEKAEICYTELRNALDKYTLFAATDDFGYLITIDSRNISYFMFVDIEKSACVNFEKDKAQNRAAEAIGKELQAMGYKPQQPPKPRIIQ